MKQRLVVFVALLFIFLAATGRGAVGQASGNGTGTNGATDPFGTTLNDSVTLSTKVNNAAKSELNLVASGSWVLGCIDCPQNTNADLGGGPGPIHPRLEWQNAASANYDDKWQSKPALTSTVVQQYSFASNLLWDAIHDDGKKAAGMRFQIQNLVKHIHLGEAGVIYSVSESHDDSQSIRSNTKTGLGIYFRPGGGNLADTDKAYYLFTVQAQEISTKPYLSQWISPSLAFYETLKIRSANFGTGGSGKNQINFSLNISEPTFRTGSRIQGAADFKYSYCVTNGVSITFEELDTYYGPGLLTASIRQDNASLATIGITYKFKPKFTTQPPKAGKSAAASSSCSQ